MIEKQPKIPDDTTLNLTREQWLALKGILENFCGENDAPFLEYFGQQVLTMMGGYTGLAFDGFDQYKEYANFYKKCICCSICGEHFAKDELKNKDGLPITKKDIQDDECYCHACYQDEIESE